MFNAGFVTTCENIFSELNWSIDFLTKRFKLINQTLTPYGITSNAGIPSHICELICSYPPLLKDFYSVLPHIYQHIIEEKVFISGINCWRWESKPSRNDYYYPPDWDDTCKAIDAIYAYNNAYGINDGGSCNIIDRDALSKLLLSSVFYSNKAGQDKTISCKNTKALYIFIADINEKPNNTEDVFVTAVTLKTFLKNWFIFIQ